MVQGTDIVVNPAHEERALHLPAADVQAILDEFSVHPMAVEDDNGVMLGQPQDDPVAMKRALAEFFQADGRVQSAYIALMLNEKTNESSMVVGVVLRNSEGNDDLFQKAATAAHAHIPQGVLLDFFMIDADPQSGTIEHYLLNDADDFFMAKTAAQYHF
jgi:hypothetical protein